jgi:RES domain-containing protein
MSGVGASFYPGRWNPLGVKMVYCAESLALATLEVRVHLAGVKPKKRFVGFEIELSVSAIERPKLSELPKSWQHAPSTSTANTAARRFGAQWVREMRSVALQVPSAVVPSESIFLLNPDHPDFSKAVRVKARSPISFDSRLWR